MGVSVTQQLNLVYSYDVQVNFKIAHISQNYIFSTARQSLAGQSRVIFLTHLDTPQSTQVLWTSDQPDAEIST